MSTSFKQQLNIIPRFYKKLIYGEYNLSKPERVYAKFKIPPGEEIIAYIPSGIPFAAPSVVITDCSLYSTMEGPFPHSQLCGHVIWQADEKAPVTLSDAVSDHTVLSGTLLPKNLPGQELVRFIHEFQERIVAAYPWAKQQRNRLANSIIEAARAEMRSGQASDRCLLLLDMLSKEEDYRDAVVLLRAENLYRTCDVGAYRRYMETLSPLVSKETRVKLDKCQNFFSENLIRDLYDDSITFSDGVLNLIYSNLSALPEYSEDFCIILALTCIRLGKGDQLQAIVEQIERRFGLNKAARLEFFKGRYYNTRMRIVYETILHGCLPSKEQCSWRDSIGLTPLHYAILLKKEDVVEKLLDERQWRGPSPLPEFDKAGGLYDYSVLACCVGYPDRRLVFQKTSEMVETQRKTRKALERRRWLKERKLDLQRESARQSRKMIKLARQNDRSDKEYEYRETLDVQKELQRQTQEEIDEINDSIHEIDYEIEELTCDSLFEAANTLQGLRESKNPFVRFLLSLYSDPDRLNHFLFGAGACRLYTYEEFIFATPDSIVIDLPHRDEVSGQTSEQREESQSSGRTHRAESAGDAKKKSDEPVRKPYGDSWFSPEAHRSIVKLKEEFRALAKRYHPDQCNHVRSKEIFQEILNERAEIANQI